MLANTKNLNLKKFYCLCLPTLDLPIISICAACYIPPVRPSSSLLLLVGFALSGCLGSSDTYTLYRNSVLDSTMRIHVATFDADSKATYNQENCQLAQDLFQTQDGVRTRFWCEKGKFRK